MKKIKKKDNWLWQVFIITFLLAIVFGYFSNIAVNNLNTFLAIIVLLLIIFIGILFDVLGMSVASAIEAPFHAKASKKNKGAKESIMLIRNAPKVSNICNDVIGDICGIISGSVGAVLSINLSNILNVDLIIISLITSAIVASLTVGGKAIGKKIAVKNNVSIINTAGSIIHFFYKVK